MEAVLARLARAERHLPERPLDCRAHIALGDVGDDVAHRPQECPLLGAHRTCGDSRNDVNDPTETLAANFAVLHNTHVDRV